MVLLLLLLLLQRYRGMKEGPRPDTHHTPDSHTVILTADYNGPLRTTYTHTCTHYNTTTHTSTRNIPLQPGSRFAPRPAGENKRSLKREITEEIIEVIYRRRDGFWTMISKRLLMYHMTSDCTREYEDTQPKAALWPTVSGTHLQKYYAV